jgi:hypothetical protein
VAMCSLQREARVASLGWLSGHPQDGSRPYQLAQSSRQHNVIAFLSRVQAVGGYAAYRAECNWQRRSSLVTWRMAFAGSVF